jgi:hypothetical protein
MLTVDQIVRLMKSGRAFDRGSCFGVTDPSQLRPAFRRGRKPASGVCGGCEGNKRHHCKGFVRTFSIVRNKKRPDSFKIERGQKSCKCQKKYCQKEGKR